MKETIWERLQLEETRLEAFEELTRTHYAQVKRWVAYWIKDPEEVEDIVQEIFLKAWKYCHTFRGEAAFSSWLYTIARREALRTLQRRKASPLLPWLWKDSEEWEEPAGEPLPNYTRLLQEVEKTVSALPPMQKTVFQTVWQSSLSYKEVAQKLGIKENTVKAHIYQVRQRVWKALRSWLGEE
ncbi:MAG: RNA polymerase sigma factor [Bacteroidia bacterium]|nr:RNA polymerase sigma factor [Bacteroidia bacterium]MDW8134941.1 RNA polymerase sigma factor [Bacteroidia bacterium]